MIYISEIESHGTHYEVSDHNGLLVGSHEDLEDAVFTAVVLAKANRDNVLIRTVDWYYDQEDE